MKNKLMNNQLLKEVFWSRDMNSHKILCNFKKRRENIFNVLRNKKNKN